MPVGKCVRMHDLKRKVKNAQDVTDIQNSTCQQDRQKREVVGQQSQQGSDQLTLLQTGIDRRYSDAVISINN